MSRFGAPPKSDLDVRPTQDDVDFFNENGYLVVDQITTPEELAWLTEIFYAVIDDNAGTGVFEPGREVGQTEPAKILQSIAPELMIPELLDTTYRRNAMHFAAALLDVPEDDLCTWSHMIKKPAGGSRPAPWHQDQAYWRPELEYHALAAWIPLHDVSVEMGAMQFIPGSHKGPLLNHRHLGDPKANLLLADDVDDATAVACPLKAGGATFHHNLTLHYTAPNVTDRDRLAYPMELELAPWRRQQPVDWEWSKAYRAAAGEGPDGGPLTYIGNGKIYSVA